jgi:SagB-type dehydrogenase family enzyme
MTMEFFFYSRPGSRREALRALGRTAMGLFAALCFPPGSSRAGAVTRKKEGLMKLPQTGAEADVSVSRAVGTRRTVRSFAPDPLSVEQLSGLLRAAQGITEERGYKRAAPSAGALYPMDVYVVAGERSVSGLRAGIHHYLPAENSLETLTGSDARDELARASLGQMWMSGAPVSLVITAEYARVCGKYGDRGVRYAMIEAGHVGQNIFLMAEALGLGAGIVGAFNDREVVRLMKIPESHEPLLIMPVGYRS